MLQLHALTRAQLAPLKRLYSVKKPDHVIRFQDLDWLCHNLNALQSCDGRPDPNLSFDEQMVLKWTEDVLAQLCPTELQKKQERPGLTWAKRARTALWYYYSAFGNWAHGSLVVKLSRGHRIPTFSCMIEPGTNRPPNRSNRGVSGSTSTNSVPLTLEGTMAVTLWNLIFLQEGYKHLKRCLHCERWFVDRGKNRIAKFCSPTCTNKWWNTERRLSSPKYGKCPNKSHKGKK